MLAPAGVVTGLIGNHAVYTMLALLIVQRMSDTRSERFTSRSVFTGAGRADQLSPDVVSTAPS